MKALEKFCESKGITDLRLIAKDRSKNYYAGNCQAIGKKIDIMHSHADFVGTVWFDGVISGMARK